MFHSTKIAGFTALTRAQKATIWESFFDALDQGAAGFHPMYDVLAPLYERGEYITAADLDQDAAQDEILVSLHPTELQQLELAIDIGEPAF